MYKGSVDFVAEIKGDRLITFPRFEFNPNDPGVDKVEIEGLRAKIRSTVHLTTVQSPEAGINLATEVNTAALNQIAFCENIAIENARVQREDFSSLDDQPGAHVLVAGTGRYRITAGDVKLIVGRSPERIKKELEQQTTPGERYYGLFRSARLSLGAVEEFMHLYHILLLLNNDKQNDVDAFIRSVDPSVPQTPHPKKPGKMETVYTRLRNEFAHKRARVDLEKTKVEMTRRLCDLRTLTKQAILRNP